MEHWFTLTLADTRHLLELTSDDEFDRLTGEVADDLFEAGCDDGTFFTRTGKVFVGFAREADSLEAAVRSAIADVQKAGCQVTRVDVEPPPFVEEINAQLAEGSAVSQ
jgi:hypothetical protein